MTEFYEIAKKRKEERMVTKEDMGKAPEDRDEFDGRPGEVIGVDSNIRKTKRKKWDEEELGEDAFYEADSKCGDVKVVKYGNRRIQGRTGE